MSTATPPIADLPRELDLNYVRSRFPSLDTDWVFFDNAGGTAPLNTVIDRIRQYMLECPVQLGASYDVSQMASARLASASDELAIFVSGNDSNRIAAEQLVFGSSTSILLTQLALALAPTLKRGDEIVITDADHAANITPWLRLADQGIRIRTWSLGPGETVLDLDKLETLMGPRTRLVCFTHATNITGSITPIQEVSDFVHSRGAKVCVDGVAYAPHRALELFRWDVDFYTFSLYKVFGPHIAVLYGKRQALLDLAGINHSFIPADCLPAKLQPGYFPYELGYAAGAVAEYFSELAAVHNVNSAFSVIADHEMRLCRRLIDYLESKPGVRIVGPGSEHTDARLPIVSFTVEGRSSASVPPIVDTHHVAVRHGHFYSPRLIDHLKLDREDGVVRVSMAHYNSHDELSCLTEALDGIL